MQQPFGMRETLLAFLVFIVAAGLRVGYVLVVVGDLQREPPFQVQDPQAAINVIRTNFKESDKEKTGWLAFGVTEHDRLVINVSDSNWYGCRAILADQEEVTAHISPGYVSLVGYLLRLVGNPGTTTQILVWTQCLLGTVTCVMYFLFARLASGSTLVGGLAGVLTAIHPFWIVNVAELQDGTLTCFLLVCILFLGTAAVNSASPVASFFFGGALAGMSLVRAALLPFSFVACIWVLLRCRNQHRGWMCALLVFLGFGNGLAPWTVRNFQVYGTLLPVTDSVFVHMWMGNNPAANGGPQNESDLRKALKPERLQSLLAEKDQARRYRLLGEDVWESVTSQPATMTIEKRSRSGLGFVFGNAWLQLPSFSQVFARQDAPAGPTTVLFFDMNREDLPSWIKSGLPPMMSGMLMFMLLFGLLGWRWNYGLSQAVSLSSLAMLWIPLPYILSHAELFSGPRLPLDGVLLSYAAFALAWLLPGFRPNRITGW